MWPRNHTMCNGDEPVIELTIRSLDLFPTLSETFGEVFVYVLLGVSLCYPRVFL